MALCNFIVLKFHSHFVFGTLLLESSVDFADVSCLRSLDKFWPFLCICEVLTHLHYCIWRWSVGPFGQGLPVGCYVGRWVDLRACWDVAESNVLPLKRIIPWVSACPILCSLATLLTELSVLQYHFHVHISTTGSFERSDLSLIMHIFCSSVC